MAQIRLLWRRLASICSLTLAGLIPSSVVNQSISIAAIPTVGWQGLPEPNLTVSQNSRPATPRRITIRWNPPKGLGAPGPRQVRSGGSRDVCPARVKDRQGRERQLTALVPEVIEGRTNTERPTFWVYLPYESRQTYSASFLLLDNQQHPVYQVDFPVTATPGIISISLPKALPTLKQGQQYYWTFTFTCAEAYSRINPNSSPVTEVVNGAVSLEPTPLDTTLTRQLAAATPEERIRLYAERGWWYDALTSLAELRRANPNDPEIMSAWTQLLQAEKLDEIAREPIISCCTPIQRR